MTLTSYLDRLFQGRSPSQLIYGSVLLVLVVRHLWDLVREGDVQRRVSRCLWRVLRKAFGGLQTKIDEAARHIRFPSSPNEKYFNELPAEGLDEETVIEMSSRLHEDLDGKMDETLLSGVVYRGTRINSDVLLRVCRAHLWSNPLLADYFGATRKMEAEVCSMVLSLFHGDSNAMACTYTMGGSESILLAMLAYRNEGRSRGIAKPNVVLAKTAHPAFDRAAALLNIRLVKVSTDPATTGIDVDEAERCITSDTVAIVASAPNFPYGTIDDTAGMSRLALKHHVGLHVDACLGGFLLQFMRDAGFAETVIDFRLPGVTSISADIHKWGASPKGASCVMFRTKELRDHHTFACSSFPGGLYVTPGINGSRPGYVVALAWASLLLNGQRGYVDATRAAITAARALLLGIHSIAELSVLGRPDATIIALTSDKVDIYCLMKNMERHGFKFNPLQFPPGIHLSVTMEHAQPGVVERLLSVMRQECVALLPREKEFSSHGVHDRAIIDEALRRYVELYHRNAPEGS
jgi:sphinganine-1-phosphate aldolase